MSTVFFKINDVQNKELQEMMEEEGYSSKAEFFRFLIKFYKYTRSPAEKNFENAAQELAHVLRKLNAKGKLSSSLDEQLSDV